MAQFIHAKDAINQGESFKLHVVNSSTGKELYFSVSLAKDNQNLGFIGFVNHELPSDHDERWRYMGIIRHDTKNFMITKKSRINGFDNQSVEVQAFKYIYENLQNDADFPPEVFIEAVSRVKTKPADSDPVDPDAPPF